MKPLQFLSRGALFLFLGSSHVLSGGHVLFDVILLCVCCVSWRSAPGTSPSLEVASFIAWLSLVAGTLSVPAQDSLPDLQRLQITEGYTLRGAPFVIGIACLTTSSNTGLPTRPLPKLMLGICLLTALSYGFFALLLAPALSPDVNQVLGGMRNGLALAGATLVWTAEPGPGARFAVVTILLLGLLVGLGREALELRIP